MSQIKTRERVSNHGEVFTSEREVNAMLDLVKPETERIESRFLEPACGDGNFLAEILRRKLAVVRNRYRKSQLEYERYAVLAVSSIYGIDILEDNVKDCRKRLFGIFDAEYSGVFKAEAKEECRASVRTLLSRNILWGDALTLKYVSRTAGVSPASPAQGRQDGGDTEEPIVFSEWSPVNGSMIKRRDYTLARLVQDYQPEPGDLFSDLGEKVFIPQPIREFPVVHFLKISEAYGDE